MTFLPALAATSLAQDQEHVILLHGLCRTQRSMATMEETLRSAGYDVTNISYPSRSASIAQLSETTIGPAIDQLRRNGATRIHFVTHSLGGILVRSYLSRHDVAELGHVVMLAPPNQGSEVVDRLSHWTLFFAINGPAGRELGTSKNSTPNRLGPATFSVGVIAGSRSINWINSCFIVGADDGKVSIERTKLAGMADHIIVRASHPFILKSEEASSQTICFLREGQFNQKLGDHEIGGPLKSKETIRFSPYDRRNSSHPVGVVYTINVTVRLT